MFSKRAKERNNMLVIVIRLLDLVILVIAIFFASGLPKDLRLTTFGLLAIAALVAIVLIPLLFG